ncbi:MAG TPA: beta-ketoacyl-ACP synthase II [Gemmatimonadaceae bacterium]|nr:beta-ketoacyl-ACP synthase II [Gemmatimonadaceae bacterium]
MERHVAERRRVAVTGIGAVTPIGTGRDALWAGLRAQRSAVARVTRFDTSAYRSHNGAQVNDFVDTDFVERKKVKRLDRYGTFSIACAKLALDDAGIDMAREDRERIGVMMGSALGGIRFAEEQLGVFLTQGIRAVEPGLALGVFGGSSSCNIAIELGAMGPNSSNAMSCASGTVAIGDAFRAIRDGYADVMFAGAAEAPLAPLCYGAFAIIRAMSTRDDDPSAASRPFDKDRDGFVMGEGAAILILEELDRALARGAHVYAEVVGYGTSNDAHHMTAPRPDGSQAARSMRLALQDAGLSPTEVAYVNAHGSSTPLNDPTETLAVKHTFGEHAQRLQVSSTKAYYGHALGASGAIEAAITALALERKWLPPTLNLDSPDEGCDLDYIPKLGREADVEYALSNSFGFGGINATVALKRHDGV